MKPTNFAISHNVATYVLAFMIIVSGLIAYVGLPREAAPDITIPVVLVTTPYYGVAPADIETLVTQPIEKELKDLKDLDTITSTSAEGASIVTVQFEPNVELDDAVQKMREKVDKAKPELPDDAEDPVLTEINFSEFPVMIVNIHGDADMVRLKEIGEELQDEIEKVNGVLKVSLAGGIEREIQVNVDPDKLEHYQLSLGEIVRALQQENVNLPGGSIDVDSMSYLVRVDGEFADATPIADIVVKDEGGQPITIGDVAVVRDTYEDPVSLSRYNGRQNVSLSIQKRAGENLVRITDEVKVILENRRPEYARHGVKLDVTADVSKIVRNQVSDLENNILTGLLLVVSVLFFFMGGARNSFFVGMAIPLSMLISFLVLAFMSVTLNMVVLFSLVLALGMLVDNAIVIVENIYRHASSGKSKAQAARDAVAEVGWPVVTSTTTTVVAFAPMLFWPGVMGEFMGYLPMTVIIVLISSLFVALIINPVLCATLMRVKPGVTLGDDAVPDNWVYRFYRGQLTWALKYRWVIVLLSFVSFVGTFVAYGIFNPGVEFFPETTPEQIMVKVTAPDGTNIDESDNISALLEERVERLDNIENFVMNIGTTSNSDFGVSGTASNQGQMSIDFFDPEDQVEHPQTTITNIRRAVGEIPGAEFELEKQGMGPPSGPPINIEVVGDDYFELGRLSQRVRSKIRDVPGLTDLKDDYVVGRPELRIRVDRRTAALTGVNTFVIADTVRSAINGVDATKIRDGEDEYDVVVRLDERYRAQIGDVSKLTVPGRDGAQVPLEELVEVEVSGGTGSIRHVDLDRVVTIKANVADGYLPNDVLAQIQERMKDEKLPAGYEVRYTGENKEQKEAGEFLTKALLAALFMIALVLVTQFNSILQPLVIVASVFLSLIGVLWGLILTNTPFGIIMVGIGIISLAGVVVNNAIVLIDYTNLLRKKGMEQRDAVITAGLVRFRPVMLTAITTILGLIPMVVGISFDFFELEFIVGSTSVEMWGPMARSVAAGLLVATVLTLIVVPVFYSLVDDFGAWLRRLFRMDAKDWTEGDGGPPSTPHGGGDTAAGKIAEQGARIATIVAVLVGAAVFLFGPELMAQDDPTSDVPGEAAEQDPPGPEVPKAAEVVPIDSSRTLSIDDAIDTARKNNYDIRLAKERIKRSRLLIDQAWSIILPRASISGTWTHYDRATEADFGPMTIEIQPQDVFSAAGTLSLTLFDGRLFPLLRNANLAQDLEDLNLDFLEREVVHGVVSGYYQLLTFRALIEVAEGSLEQQRFLLENTEGRKAAGTAIEFEVIRARTEVLKAEKEVEKARLAFLSARESLAVLLVTEADFDVLEIDGSTDPPNIDSLMDSATEKRSDLAALRERVTAAENDIEVDYWRYAPTVSANLNALAQEETAFGPEPFSWNLMVTARWELYDGGLREASIKEKKSLKATSILELEKQEATINGDLRRAYKEVLSSRSTLASSAEQVALAERALDQAQTGYRLGAVRQVDVIDAEIALRIAKTAQVRDLLTYRLGVQNLLRLAGEEYRR